MPYLVVAVVLVGLVAGINLIFTYGVIRRLREHTELISTMSAGYSRGTGATPEVGSEPVDFAPQLTTDGKSLTRADLRGALLGFFSPGCAPCHEQSRVFAARAADLGSGRAVAVVVGTTDETAELVAVLEPTSRVLVEADRGPVQAAFAVDGFPTLCVLDEHGRIKASGRAVTNLPELLAA